MYFKIVLNQICTFCMYLCLLLLSMNPFLRHFLFSSGVRYSVVCFSIMAVLLSIFLPILVWPFTFTAKSDCDITFNSKIDFVLSVSSIITITVKLLQIILRLCYWFCGTSVCLSLFIIYERYTLHIIIVFWNMHLILVGSGVPVVSGI